METKRARLRIAGAATFIIFAFLSWFIGYNQEAEWVGKVVAPEYKSVSVIIIDMVEEQGSIDSSDPKFKKILNAFWTLCFDYPYIWKDAPPDEISEIRILDSESYEIIDDIIIWSIFNSAESSKKVHFYSNGKIEETGFIRLDQDLSKVIHTVLWDEPLFRWIFAIFSISVVSSFVFLYSAWQPTVRYTKREVKPGFIFYWILGSITGYIIGSILYLTYPSYLFSWGFIYLSVVIIQGLILQTQFLRIWDWIFANIISMIGNYYFQKVIVGYMLENYYDLINGNYDAILFGTRVISIFLLLIPQWFVFKQYVRHAWMWVFVGIITYLGSAIVFRLASDEYSMFDDFGNDIMLGLLRITLNSLILGATLYWLLKNHRREDGDANQEGLSLTPSATTD